MIAGLPPMPERRLAGSGVRKCSLLGAATLPHRVMDGGRRPTCVTRWRPDRRSLRVARGPSCSPTQNRITDGIISLKRLWTLLRFGAAWVGVVPPSGEANSPQPGSREFRLQFRDFRLVGGVLGLEFPTVPVVFRSAGS